MLVLTRKEGQRINLSVAGQRVTISVQRCGPRAVRIGIEARQEVAIVRAELEARPEVAIVREELEARGASRRVRRLTA